MKACYDDYRDYNVFDHHNIKFEWIKENPDE